MTTVEDHQSSLSIVEARAKELAHCQALLDKPLFSLKTEDDFAKLPSFAEQLGLLRNIAWRPKDTNSLIHKSVTTCRANSKYHSLTN